MSNILKIVRHPDPLLRRRSVAVVASTIKDRAIQDFIDDMIATMWQEDGVGLAAPQVGRSIRLIIITQDKEAIPLVNPVISRRSFRKDVMEEGCLSVPGFFGEVRRPLSIRVTAVGRDGSPVRLRADGLLARIIQHEVDHLDGILFIDRAKNIRSIATGTKL